MAAMEKRVEVKQSRMADADTRAATRNAFRAELQAAIDGLDLVRNVAELDMQGYTVIRDAAPIAFFPALRARILEISQERRNSGTAGDRRGRKGMFLLGVALFGLGSLAAGLAPTIGLLMAARVLQGIGGASREHPRTGSPQPTLLSFLKASGDVMDPEVVWSSVAVQLDDLSFAPGSTIHGSVWSIAPDYDEVHGSFGGHFEATVCGP